MILQISPVLCDYVSSLLYHLCKWIETFNIYFKNFSFPQLNWEVKMQFFLCGYLLAISLINSFWIVWWKCQWGKTWVLMEVLIDVIYLKVNWNRISWNTDCLRVRSRDLPMAVFVAFCFQLRVLSKELP